MLVCRLREIRHTKYMINKTGFAKLLEINYRQYLRYEDGVIPQPETMFIIAKKLNMRVDEIWYLD